MAQKKTREKTFDENLKDKNWRMSNLYYIQNEAGVVVQFRPSDIQLKFTAQMWYLNLILKARQLGFTTLIDLWILDECYFYPNQNAGIIAHSIKDAQKIFKAKIKFPLSKLPGQLIDANPSYEDNQTELSFANGSSIWVGTSMRSATLQYLHVSEFGKISSKYPEKAEEIKSGAFNTVHEGSYIFVESTAEGRAGEYYDMVKTATKVQDAGKGLTRLDFKFHFEPWWIDRKYRLSDEDCRLVVWTQADLDYFKKLRDKYSIVLTKNQEAWYIKKQEQQTDKMKREFPSYPEEAFEVAVEGAYFADQIVAARKAGRICKVPFDEYAPVNTFWDLGRADANPIWFAQTIGREIHVIDFYENSGVGMLHYFDILRKFEKEKKYRYGRHCAPHDIKQHEYALGATRISIAKKAGIIFEAAPMPAVKQDHIDAARAIFPQCWFDESATNEGMIHLENYRKEWDAAREVYKDQPRHDKHSHAADAFMVLAVMTHKINQGVVRAQPVVRRTFNQGMGRRA